MSDGKQEFRLRCKACLAAGRPKNRIEVIGATPSEEGVKVVCRECGKESTRRSFAAQRAYEQWKNERFYIVKLEDGVWAESRCGDDDLDPGWVTKEENAYRFTNQRAAHNALTTMQKLRPFEDGRVFRVLVNRISGVAQKEVALSEAEHHSQWLS